MIGRCPTVVVALTFESLVDCIPQGGPRRRMVDVIGEALPAEFVEGQPVPDQVSSQRTCEQVVGDDPGQPNYSPESSPSAPIHAL